MIRWLWVSVMVVVAVGVVAQERLVLDAPVFVSPGVTTFRVSRLELRRETAGVESTARVRATLQELDGNGFVAGGKTLECVYQGQQAEALIVALNRADLSTNSLERRVITRCQTDGKLGPGAIQGAP